MATELDTRACKAKAHDLMLRFRFVFRNWSQAGDHFGSVRIDDPATDLRAWTCVVEE